MARIIGSAALVVAGAMGAVLSSGALAAEKHVGAASYTCAGGRTIKATYYADKVRVVLSDGRTLTLPQTQSGSGIRYANGDQSFVFWSKGTTAFVEEGPQQTETYSNCNAPHV